MRRVRIDKLVCPWTLLVHSLQLHFHFPIQENASIPIYVQGNHTLKEPSPQLPLLLTDHGVPLSKRIGDSKQPCYLGQHPSCQKREVYNLLHYHFSVSSFTSLYRTNSPFYFGLTLFSRFGISHFSQGSGHSHRFAYSYCLQLLLHIFCAPCLQESSSLIICPFATHSTHTHAVQEGTSSHVTICLMHTLQVALNSIHHPRLIH